MRFTVRAVDTAAVARIKGDRRMADVVRNTVVDRVRPPAEDVRVTTTYGDVTLSATTATSTPTHTATQTPTATPTPICRCGNSPDSHETTIRTGLRVGGEPDPDPASPFLDAAFFLLGAAPVDFDGAVAFAGVAFFAGLLGAGDDAFFA